MKKFYITNKEDLNDEELRTGCVSYKRIIDRYIQDLVLCVNITDIDFSVYNNIQHNEDAQDEDGLEIYQYFLCNLSEFERKMLLEYGIILSYSDMLGLDVLCVNHLGTAWDYVMCDVQWSEDWNDIRL